MNLLRSNFLIAIVSLFVFTGYSHAVLDRCCSEEKQSETSQSVPMEDGGCQCLCHQITTLVPAQPAHLPAALPAREMVYFSSDEFPPDAVPKGVEVPPQII